MKPLDLEAIKEREAKAPAGPWVVEPSYGGEHGYDIRRVGSSGTEAITIGDDGGGALDSEEGADFIAHSREDIPALIEEIERLRNEIAEFIYNENHGESTP